MHFSESNELEILESETEWDAWMGSPGKSDRLRGAQATKAIKANAQPAARGNEPNLLSRGYEPSSHSQNITSSHAFLQ